MSIASIKITSFILIAMINLVCGYKTNLILNLSSIEINGRLTIGIYNTYLLDDLFSLPLKHDDHILVQHMFGSKVLYIGSSYYLIVKIGENIWNLTMIEVPKSHICDDYYETFQINMDKVLMEAFRCQHLMHGIF